jgi:hypothetical protein
VRPPRVTKPVKLNTISVGTLQFMPSNWHMVLALREEFYLCTLACPALLR